jgi:hypothetical protein
MYYDAKYGGAGSYAGFFHPITYNTTCVYEVFRAFGRLYEMGNQAELICDSEEVVALASTNGRECGVIITNPTDEDKTVLTNLDDGFKAYIIDENNLSTPTELDASNFTIKANQVIFLKKR